MTWSVLRTLERRRGEEKDLIKESEKLSLGQVKRRKKKPWKLMVRPKMRTGTI